MKNPKQLEAFHSKARFKFILAGRRGGKTFIIKHDIARTIQMAPEGAEIFYIGPTNQQAKELMWDALDECLYKANMRYWPYVSKQRFEFPHKRKIYIIGAEKIRRIRGHSVFKVYLDEIAYFDVSLKSVWEAVRPTLTDLRGSAICATTPNGKGTEAYDFYLQTLSQPNWKYFHWKTLDNPWISPAEIEEAKRELDEKSFRQEYEAQWQSFEGLAYYNFDEDLHIKQNQMNETAPLHLCFDFNVNPTTLLLSQKFNDKLCYLKEYSFKNSSTEETVRAFCEDFKSKAENLFLKVRGDASGAARSANTGKADYFYVEQMLSSYGFRFQKEVKPSNPPIIDRVKIVNGWLRPLSGEPRVEVDPSCKDLIRDLSSQELNGRIPSDTNNLGHKADAFGYDIFYENMMAQRKPQTTIRL